MQNGKNILKTLGTIFLMLGIVGGLIAIVLLLFVPVVGKILAICFFGIFGVFLLAGVICTGIYTMQKSKKEKLINNGYYIMAEVVDIDVNIHQKVTIDRISMNPYVITCRYVDEVGKEYFFKSKSLLYNPSALLKQNLLKVYVDLTKPKKYYVDTSTILPDNAILHKFKFDSNRNAENLMQEGRYIEAVTCGVELIGRISVNGIVKAFLQLPMAAAEKIGVSLDEKGRAFIGYTVLCRYDAPDGKIHIFASKGIYGDPKREFVGDKVKVYYSGDNYKYYHVDIGSMA